MISRSHGDISMYDTLLDFQNTLKMFHLFKLTADLQMTYNVLLNSLLGSIIKYV